MFQDSLSVRFCFSFNLPKVSSIPSDFLTDPNAHIGT